VASEHEPPDPLGAAAIAGPGSAFRLLFDDAAETGLALPAAFRAIYPGSWDLPSRDRPYVYVNFVLSRDGRVSFDEPGHSSGAEISGCSIHDRWLMGLLRARADAILMGDNTLRIEPDHVWSAEYIFPDDADAFAGLRRAEGRAPLPLQVFLSLEGDVDVGAAAIFAQDSTHVVLATTARGADLEHVESSRGPRQLAGSSGAACGGREHDMGAVLREDRGCANVDVSLEGEEHL